MSSKQEHPIQAMGFWLFELIDPVGRINGYASKEFSSADYLLVQRVRTVLQRQVDRLFDEFDVLATAGESSVASLLNAPPQGRFRRPDRETCARRDFEPVWFARHHRSLWIQ